MFILFGNKETRHNYGPIIPVICPHCHNPTNLRLGETKKWFTLFLIPILPYESTYWLTCEICSRGVELDDDQFEKAKRVCRAARAWRAERISRERYETILKRSRLIEYTSGGKSPGNKVKE